MIEERGKGIYSGEVQERKRDGGLLESADGVKMIRKE